MLQTKKFQKRIEDFICDRCGTVTRGSDCNHCSKCLWSKHVDINPGDRQSTCGGLLEPVAAEVRKSGREYVIHYVCQKCGDKSRARAAKEDSSEELIKLINKPITD
ncbi:MAG: RNHCP domain-containing protein [Candidatus Paceibacterota bacterium]|jgi:hypothetical protein